MKKTIALILILIIAAATVSSCGDKPAPAPSGTEQTVEPTESTSTAPAPVEDSPAESENTGSTEPSEYPTAEEAAREMIRSFESATALLGPGATAREIAIEMKTYAPYIANYDVNEAIYYCPGLGFSFSLDGISSVYYLMDNFLTRNNIIYIFDIEKDADTDEIIKRIDENAELDFQYNDDPATVKMISKVSTQNGDKIIFLMFDETVGVYDDGKVAQTPREIVGIFDEYRTSNPGASALDTASYIMNHQKVAQSYTKECEPGRLTGFFNSITGFKECAVVSPMMMPNTFIGYVFTLDAGADAAEVREFIDMLKREADLAWNVCMSANTIITDCVGNVVLFMMCSEW